MSELSVRQPAQVTAPGQPGRPGQPGQAARAGQTGHAARQQRIALVDLLDRVLAGGVVIAGEVTLSVADVDMVVISLRALVTSVSALARPEPGGRHERPA